MSIISQKYSDAEFLIIKKKLLTDGKLNVRIISGSMEPLIKTGETVIVEPVNDLKKFDIILYHSDDKNLICHFFWRESHFQKNALLIQAFGHASLDQVVYTDKILGKVTSHKINFLQKLIFLMKWCFRKKPS